MKRQVDPHSSTSHWLWRECCSNTAVPCGMPQEGDECQVFSGFLYLSQGKLVLDKKLLLNNTCNGMHT